MTESDRRRSCPHTLRVAEEQSPESNHQKVDEILHKPVVYGSRDCDQAKPSKELPTHRRKQIAPTATTRATPCEYFKTEAFCRRSRLARRNFAPPAPEENCCPRNPCCYPRGNCCFLRNPCYCRRELHLLLLPQKKLLSPKESLLLSKKAAPATVEDNRTYLEELVPDFKITTGLLPGICCRAAGGSHPTSTNKEGSYCPP